MRWMDSNFKANRVNYILQSLMAFAVIFIMTFVIDVFLETAVLASLGATVFIVFTMPHTQRSRPRYILGGYTVGVFSGLVCSLIIAHEAFYVQSLTIALAVGLAVFLMVITDTEHPPAAAVAMGVAVDGADVYMVAAVFICLFFVLGAKFALRKWLINLL